MADRKPRFYTLRKHRKKSIFFAAVGCWLTKYAVDRFREYLIRRELCEEAKVFAQETTPAIQKPRRYTLFFNATAGNGDADKLFKRNAEPILHLAGLDVTIIKTDYEGQIKTLLQYIDPSIDGIIVAGGDGTLLEAVTGLLRRTDQEQLSRIPFGVLPVGTKNSFYQRIFGKSKVTQAREIGQAALAIVKGETCSVDVMEIKGEEGRSTFALNNIHWGAFRDAAVNYDKYWLSGPFRKKMAYIAATLKGWPPTHQAVLKYPKPNISSRQSSSLADNNERLVSSRFMAHTLASATEIPHNNTTEEKSHNNTTEESVIGGWVNSPMETIGLSMQLSKNKQEQGVLDVTVWPSVLPKMDFIRTGWKMLKGENNTSTDSCEVFQVQEITLEPKDVEGSWFSIDGEPFDARPIQVKVHQDKLKFFTVKNV